MYNENKLLYEFKPRFNKKIIFLRSLPYNLFFSFWVGTLSGLTTDIFYSNVKIKLIPLYVGIISGFLTFSLFPIPILLYFKNLYKKTSYYIFDDRIESEEGIFYLRKKELSFKNIKEINLRTNSFKNKTELGNIFLCTRKDKNRKVLLKYRNFCIKDVPDSVVVYKKLSELLF